MHATGEYRVSKFNSPVCRAGRRNEEWVHTKYRGGEGWLSTINTAAG